VQVLLVLREAGEVEMTKEEWSFMSKKPFFSVIVPAHNAEDFIEKGLHSIKMQTFTDYELIVVCDNCTDRTAEIALNYADKTLIRDYGLDGLARNAGIEAAEGEWVLFMDHDDWWLHEYAFQMLAAFLEQRMGEPLDVVLFNFIWKGRGYCQQTRFRTVAVWNKCWRREFIGDTRFPAKPYWSDVDFNRDMFDKMPIVMSMDHALYYYNYLKEGSISWREKQGEIEGYKEG
jgi:glycosyltransferase involved in cell wall biosynthesis